MNGKNRENDSCLKGFYINYQLAESDSYLFDCFEEIPIHIAKM